MAKYELSNSTVRFMLSYLIQHHGYTGEGLEMELKYEDPIELKDKEEIVSEFDRVFTQKYLEEVNSDN